MNGVVSELVVRRLRWHAGLEHAGDPLTASVSACTSPDGALAGRLDAAVADFLKTLGQVNKELHGPVPSESSRRVDSVPIRVAYAVSEVVRLLREHSASRAQVAPHEAASREAWLVDVAWSAVLAGDIDNLEEHLAHEEMTRGVHP